MSKTILYQITETSKFMMSFVLVTQGNNCIVIDGGREEDMPLLKAHIGSRHLLKSDIVQMAHHGHMNVSIEVYAAVMPEACLWCCADWLYNEVEEPSYLSDVERLTRMKRIRMYGTAVTRQWMDILGGKKTLCNQRRYTVY